jgi:hypothetical protein
MSCTNLTGSVVAAAVWLLTAHAVAAEVARAAPENATSGATGPVEDSDKEPRVAAAEQASSKRAAAAGLLLPTLLAPKLHDGTAYAVARSGYDGAPGGFVARAVAEASVAHFLALHLEYEHGPSMGPEDRMRVGARVALLEQAAHGIDGGVALFYDPKDFREEGNIVGGLLVGREFGRVSVFANALFGSDPEGDDQTLELRLATLYRAADLLHVGLDARGRYNMSSDAKRAGTLTTDYEVWGLGTASLELGAVALVADAGISARQTTGPFGQPDETTNTSVGLLVLGGAAGAF